MEEKEKSKEILKAVSCADIEVDYERPEMGAHFEAWALESGGIAFNCPGTMDWHITSRKEWRRISESEDPVREYFTKPPHCEGDLSYLEGNPPSFLKR